MACYPDTTQHSVTCLISLSSWKNFRTDDEIRRSHWVYVTTIPIQGPLLQPAQ